MKQSYQIKCLYCGCHSAVEMNPGDVLRCVACGAPSYQETDGPAFGYAPRNRPTLPMQAYSSNIFGYPYQVKP